MYTSENKIETLVDGNIIMSYVITTYSEYVDNGYSGYVVTKLEHLNSERQLHNEDGPAIIEYYENGKISSEKWYRNGKMHRDGDLPASVGYFTNGNISSEKWYQNDKLHRSSEGGDLPALVEYYEDGTVKSAHWRQNGKQYRDCDRPLSVYYHKNGNIWYEEWSHNGRLHRMPSQQNGKGELEHKPSYIRYNPEGKVLSETYSVYGIQYNPNNKLQFLNAILSVFNKDELDKVIKIVKLIKE